MNLKEYNQGIIESAKNIYPNHFILDLIKKWLRNSGCQINITTSEKKIIFEVHHEMEKNWSIVMCESMGFILELLDYKVARLYNANDWFSIDYS